MDAVATLQAFLHRSAADRCERVAAHEARLRATLPALVERLYALGAERVWLFGSLAHGDVHERSDIDLAVEGLRPGTFFDAYADLLDAAEARVDLVDLSTAPPSLREHILASGRALSRAEAP